MTKVLQRRTFLIKAGLLFGGALVVGGRAFGQAARYQVRMIDQRSRPGLKMRLERMRINSLDDAFKLANKKSEIEVTS